jgi:tetratricopeptide (TPR) repeat protein
MRQGLLLAVLAAASVPADAQTKPAAQQARPGARASRPAEPPAVVLARADAAFAAKQIDAAARLYASVAERHESVRALLGLARIQSGRGNPRQALQTLERARALAPNSEDVLSAFARVALAARAPVVAILTLEPLARMLPSVMEYHYLLGVAMMQAGDMPSAVFALQDALAIEPNRSVTLVALGLAFNSQKLYAEARAPLLRSLEIEPDNLEALAALAESEEGEDELAASETHAQRVLAREGGNAIANLVMGLVRMKQQRYAEARGFLERAIATDPLSGKAHYQLSLACARLGDTAGQEKHLALYRSVQQEVAARLDELRGAVGAQKGGMSQ